MAWNTLYQQNFKICSKREAPLSFRAQIEAKLPTDSFSEIFSFLLPSVKFGPEVVLL